MALLSRLGGIGRALEHRNYRLYWAGGAISILGFWLHKLALGWLTWDMTHSPMWLGIIGFSATFPAAFISPFAGAVADRYGLRKTAMFAIAVSSMNAFMIGLVTFLGLMTIEILLIQVIIQGISFSFDLPARQSLVHIIVPRSELSSAIALNTTTFHLGAFVGAALFGVVVTTLGTSYAFFFNSFAFLTFIFTLAALKLPPRPPRKLDGSTIFGDMIEGLRYTFRHDGIFAVLSLTAAAHLLVRPYIDLLPAFADTVFGLGESGFATLASATGLGSLVGGIYLAVRGKTEGLTSLHTYGLLTCIIALAGFAATDNYPLAIACMAVVGFGLIAVAVASQSLVQNAVDSTKRARVISLSTGLAIGLPAFGALALGAVGDSLGVQAPVLGAMALCFAYWLWARPRLKRLSASIESDPNA